MLVKHCSIHTRAATGLKKNARASTNQSVTIHGHRCKRSIEFRNDDDRESLAAHDPSSLCQLRATPPPVDCQGQVRVTEQNIFLYCVYCELYFSPEKM